MEFEVTASRKRPQSLLELSGQDFVVATLQNSIESGRIAHAYLFSGPRGVGKTSSARILAKSLNCEKGPAVSPCGECSNCREITKGISMDVIEIDGASNTGVNDIREIKDEVMFGPGSSRYKIYIIDEVHMLSNSAFNALLKTIEEPPPYIIFIFATTEIHKVPATIRSRCQQFNFRLVDLTEIKRLLITVCEEGSIQYDEDALLWIARESTGSVRDAYTLFDQVAAFSEGHITLEKIREKLGLIGMEQLNNLMTFLVEENGDKALELLDSILAGGVSVEQFLLDMAEYLRNMLFLGYGIEKESLLGYGRERFPESILEELSRQQLEWALEQTIQLYRDIRFSLNPRFELELLVSRLSSIRSHLDSRMLLKELARMKNQIESLAQNPSGGELKKKILNPFQDRNIPPPPDDLPEQQKEKAPASTTLESPPPEISAIKTSKPQISESESASPPVNEVSIQGEVSLSELKTILMKVCETERSILAATLNKARDWTLEDKKLILTFSTAFDSTFIKAEGPYIQQVLKEKTGREFRVETQVAETRKGYQKEEKDTQLEMICSVFRGSLV